MNAPDRIFAEEPDVFDGMGLWHSEGPYAEYIRADLHDTAIAAAKAEAIDAVEREVMEWLDAPSLPGNEQAAIYDQACYDILRYIVALKVRP